MRIEIRQAKLKDAHTIHKIIRLSFGDDVSLARLKQRIALKNNFTLVAEIDGQVGGFVDSFLTVSSDDQVRYELDLLAVDPDARGHGLGKELIQASIVHARQLGVAFLRALVASDNVFMQKACQSAGLKQSEDLFSLYVISPQDVTQSYSDTGYCIAVDTLTYSGLWLEGDISSDVVVTAHSIGLQRGADVIGAVVRKSDDQTIKLLSDQRFSLIGDYRWWLI